MAFMDEQGWSIGELDRTAGVTVRTLRHYDDIGLLSASNRTAAGHRRYSQADLWRLLRIRSLRRLGLSLEDVSRVMGAPADDPTALQQVLRTELGRLEARAAELESTIARVREQLDRIDRSAGGTDLLARSMEVHSMLEGYFTDEQKQQIVARRDRLGDRDQDLRAEWVGLLKGLSESLKAGVPASDPEVQRMSARWDEIGTAYVGEDPAIRESAHRLWQENTEAVSSHVSRAIGWMDPGQMPAVVAYVGEARDLRTGASG
jgi:DNA-binding transcriptional MerR regulator